MNDQVFHGFLRRQFEQGMALARESDLMDLIPIEGDPPCRHIVSLRAKGLTQDKEGAIVEAARCDIGIWMPDDYLRRVEVTQVLTYLGPSPRPWHPNIRPPFICVHLRPGTPLVDLLYVCFELWTWHLFSTGDEGLNHAASQWARNQDRSRFPIDRRPLRRRELQLRVSTKEKACNF